MHSPMAQEHKTVFISYRRNVASFIARAIFQDLRDHNYDVFMDVESIDNGQFDTIILKQIEARAHFLLILTPGTVERCVEPGDWLRREIEFAMDKQRNIVPLLINGFSFKSSDKYLTGKLSDLPRYNGIEVPHNFFDEAMDRLRTRFLKQPVVGEVKSVGIVMPAGDDPTPAPADPPHAKRVTATFAPAPTRAPVWATAPVTVADFARRGYERYRSGDFSGAVDDYSAALDLNPRYLDAYYNRGLARTALGDLSGAIKDYQTYLERGGGVRSGDHAQVEQAIRDLRRRLRS